MGDEQAAPPIFLLGMMRRSGTNFFADVMRLHPHITYRRPIWEDYLLHHAGHLFTYVDSLFTAWPDEWNVDPREGATLLAELGRGVEQFLSVDCEPGQRVLTKSPRATNLARFRDLFPDAPLLVLVRDGRSMVESTVRSGFERNHEAAMHAWAAAAEEVLAADRVLAGDPRYLMVRYEDLLDDLAGTARAALSVCGLDPDQWDADAAAVLPVRGSSETRATTGEVTWKPMAKTADFRPRERWSDWSDQMHRRFAAVAGAQQRALGYDLAEGGPARPQELVRGLLQRGTWTAQRGLRRGRRIRDALRSS